MAEERSGFLGRWARRKTEALQGKPLDEPAVADKARAAPLAGTDAAASKSDQTAFAPMTAAANRWRAADQAGTASSSAPAAEPVGKSAAAPDANANAPAPEKTLSLDDVKALTQDSDFKPFMARHVGADVRNAAMKKLFADPHYNVMDGLDIYIDDYSIADPLPQAMLRQMASAKFLNLFDDKEGDKTKKKATARTADMAHTASAANEAQDGAAAQADAMPAPADDSLKTPDVQNLSQPDVQSLTQLDAQSLIQPDTAAQSAEPSTPARVNSISSLSADHASQPEPAPGSGASQDHHAHSHLRLQPDHAAPAPNAGRGT